MDFQAQTIEGQAVEVSVSKVPDTCPICHFSVEPKYRGLAHVLKDVYDSLELAFQCPRIKCQHFFISRYQLYPGWSSRYYQYLASVPFDPLQSDFPENVEKISPSFCAVANEAQNAEHQGWKLIAGPGYRKALEFLVKDYLCRVRPADLEKIKSTQLGQCIAKFVEDEKIKSVAARAAWLGNDETHYARKWEDKDLEDLKKLVQLTVHWIEMSELTESVINEMPEGKE
jgi:hypothetical protein